MTLEEFRRQARAGASAARQRLSRERHQQILVHDQGVLRQPVVIPLDELLRAEMPRTLTAQELARRSEAAAALSAEPVLGAAPGPQPAAPVVADPFREDAPALESPPAAAPAAPRPAPQPPAAAEESPEAEADDDPFGDFGT